MKPQEGIMGVGRDRPSGLARQGTGKEEQTVAEIRKLFHSKTKMAKPKAVATSSFKTRYHANYFAPP